MPIPKLSAPLVKDIRTGEGIAEWALGIGVAALTSVGDLSVAHGATYLTILAAMKGVRRGLLKISAIQSPFGIGAPTQPTTLLRVEKDVAGVLDAVEPVVDPAASNEPVAAKPEPTTVAPGKVE